MKEIQTRKVEKHKHVAYLNKASSFHRGMKDAEQNGDWTEATLNAIHCAISCTDALTTFYLGQHAAGQRHEDATVLLRQTNLPGAEEKAKQLVDVLALKTLVEYEPEEPTENEAKRAITQADRIYQWTKSHLNKT